MLNLRSLVIKLRLRIWRLLCSFTLLFLTLFVSNLTYALTSTHQVSAQEEKHLQATKSSPLIVGSEQDFPPFATGMTDDTAGGFTVDLWKAVAEEAGLTYTIRVLPFHQLLEEFKAGKIDVLINLAQSDQRKKFADFTVPHVVVHGAIFVRKARNAIRSEADLSGKSIIVLRADLAHDYAVSKGWERQLVLVNTAEEGLRLLASGKHDAMLLSKLVGMQTLQATGLTNLQPLKTEVGFSQKFSFAVQKGQSHLLEKINEALVVTKADETFDETYEHWFGIYEVKETSLHDKLKYLAPIVFIFICILGYSYHRRRAERIAADKAIKNSEALIRSLLKAIPDLIWLKDTQGVYLACNTAFEQFFGAKEADILGKTDYDFVDKALADFFRENDKLAMLAGKPSVNEERLTFAEGGYHGVFETIKTPILDGDGKVIGVLGIARDVTERKQAEVALKESEFRWKFAIEGSGDGVWDWNMQTDEVHFSARWKEMFGYSDIDIPSTQGEWYSLIHPDDQPHRENAIQAYLEGKTDSYVVEYRLKCKDDSYKWVLGRGMIVSRSEDGKPLRMIGTNADISERKHLELELIKQAHLDYLTGISNRRYFMEQGEVELSRALRYDTPLSLMMLDVDFFKRINDTYGHQVGDNVLQVLSKVCQETMRQIDVVGRLGGEEFAVILPVTKREEALEVAERLRQVIAKTAVTIPVGLPIHFTVSIGVTTLTNKEMNIDTLLNQADKALYEAKESGRNKVCVG